MRSNMLATSNLTNEEMDFAQLSKQFSKRLSEKLQLDEETAGRLTYTLILEKLTKQIHESLPFRERSIDKLCQKASTEFDLKTEQLEKNPQLLDILYEFLINPAYKKKYGQFFTPSYIADFMASWINQYNPSRILDPAVGTGIFLENIINTSPNTFSRIYGLDIDPILLNACYLRMILLGLSKDKFQLEKQDFIAMGSYFGQKVEAVICNPPYLNFHDFDRNGLVKAIEERLGVKLSRLTNIYVLFFLQSLSLTQKNGRLAFITPSEFLYTGYGEELKEFLLKNTTLDALVLLDFESSVFNQAITTAVITLFRKGAPDQNHLSKLIRIHSWPGTKDLLKAVNEGVKNERYRLIEVYQNQLDPKKKWLEHFMDMKNSHALPKLVPLSELASIKRGIATGYNNYFLFTKSKIQKWKIESRFLVPVVSNAYQIKGYEFTLEDWTKLAEKDEKVYLLYVFEEPSSNLKAYISYGEQEDVRADKRFITRHRSPWYSMEKRIPPEILATVFHREEMKFILNSAKIRNLAPFHCVYPKFDDPLMIKALLAYLNSDFCREIQTIKRREYGGGLHKFEPRDLENIPTLDVTRLSRFDVEKLASFFDNLNNASKRKEGIREVRKALDDFLQHIISSPKSRD
jgi:adenine-specific DNA-methyltransferase